MSTQQFFRALRPEEQAYHDELKKQPIDEIERRLAALREVKARFLCIMRLPTYAYVSSCIDICSQLIVEHVANTGLTLSAEELADIDANVKSDQSLVSTLASTAANALEEVDVELEAAIARHYAIHPLGQLEH